MSRETSFFSSYLTAAGQLRQSEGPHGRDDSRCLGQYTLVRCRCGLEEVKRRFPPPLGNAGRNSHLAPDTGRQSDCFVGNAMQVSGFSHCRGVALFVFLAYSTTLAAASDDELKVSSVGSTRAYGCTVVHFTLNILTVNTADLC